MPPRKRNVPGRAAAAAPAELPTSTERAAAHNDGDPTLRTREAQALLDCADTKPLRDALRKLGVEFRDANSGGPGGPHPAPLASRLHRIPTHYLFNFHRI